MVKTKFEVEISVPYGFKIIAYRQPKTYEQFLVATGIDYWRVDRATFDFQKDCHFIVEKVIEYRAPMMPADYGKTIEFSDDQNGEWVENTLCGLAVNPAVAYPWMTEDGLVYKFARIKV